MIVDVAVNVAQAIPQERIVVDASTPKAVENIDEKRKERRAVFTDPGADLMEWSR